MPLNDLESRSLLAAEQFVRLGIVDKRFALRVPLQLTPESHRDVAEMASADAAVLTFDVGDRFAAGADTVEEVAHVVDDRIELAHPLGTIKIVEVVNLPVRSWQRIAGQIFDRLALDRSAIDKDPSRIAGEHDAVATVVSDRHRDAVGVLVGHAKIDGNVVAVHDVGVFRLAIDLDGQAVDGPLRDVEMMGSPIGHLSAGVFVPPAEGVMRTFLDVRHIGRLALPQIPVEVRRHLSSLKRTAGHILAQHHVDLLQFADATLTDHLDRQSKSMIAPLPRTDLHDTARLLHDVA